MDEKAPARTREERLAQQLRENLRRRKTQARAMQSAVGEGREGEAKDTTLPKPPADS